MTDIPAELARALADRYALRREAGRGGMATVYLADDVKHRRVVAVKVLRPEVAVSLGSERFLREIELTAQLSHPHILPLYDSGRAGDILYYVMPYVDGESLRDRLDREQQLPVDEALRLTREIGDALGHAHSYGIIHRDLKPENVLLQAGHAVVADFGIARAMAAAGGERLTDTGIAIGTPAYMSPEQSSGSDRIDARSDVYALGCVLYEMLTGEPPYTGPTPQAVIAKRLSEPVPHVSTLRETVLPHVERALGKALAKTPADRFTTMAEFVAALSMSEAEADADARPSRQRRPRALTVAIAAVAVVGGLALAFGPRLFRPATADLTRVAVLPCANRMGDPSQDYVAAGVHDELVTALGRFPTLEVRGRASVLRYRDRAASNPEMARELGVGGLVECSLFRTTGDTVRATVTLQDGRADRQFWSAAYQRPATDAFTLGRDIARGVADALRATVTRRDTAGATAPSTTSPEALVEYHRGRYFATDWGEANFASGIEHFRRAIALDSNFAPAYVALAEAIMLQGDVHGAGEVRPRDFIPEVRGLVQHALALDPELAAAHALLGAIRWEYDFDFQGAVRATRQATELDPTSPLAWDYHALALSLAEQHEDAMAAGRRAVELDPAAPWILSDFSVVLQLAHRFDEALDAAATAIALDPGLTVATVNAGDAAYFLGDYPAALSYHERALELDPDDPIVQGLAAIVFARVGQRSRVERTLGALLDLRNRRYVSPRAIAAAYLALDSLDAAIDWYIRAAETSTPSLMWDVLSPHADVLRDHPRYPELLRLLRLEP